MQLKSPDKQKCGTVKLLTLGTIALTIVAFVVSQCGSADVLSRSGFQFPFQWGQSTPQHATQSFGIGLSFNLRHTNLFGRDPLTNGRLMYKQPIVDSCLNILPAQTPTKKSLRVYDSMKSFVQEMSKQLDASASGSGWGYSISASVDAVTTKSSSYTGSLHVAKLDLSENVDDVKFASHCQNDPQQHFDKTFLKNFETLDLYPVDIHRSSRWSNYQTFIDLYGTHVMTGFSRGNSLRLFESTTSSKTISADVMKAKACISFEGDTFVKMSASACAQVSNEAKKNATNTMTTQTVVAAGGTAATRAAVNAHETVNAKTIQDFMNSWGDSDATHQNTDLQFASIWSVMHAIFHPDCVNSNNATSYACHMVQRAKNLEAYYVGIVDVECTTHWDHGDHGNRIMWLDYAPNLEQAPSGLVKWYSCWLAREGSCESKQCKPHNSTISTCACTYWNQAGSTKTMIKPSWLDTRLFENVFPSCVNLNSPKPSLVLTHGKLKSYNEVMRAFASAPISDESSGMPSDLVLPTELQFFSKLPHFEMAYFSLKKVTEVMAIDAGCLNNPRMLDPSTMNAIQSLPLRISSSVDAMSYEGFLKQHGEYVAVSSSMGYQATVFAWAQSGTPVNGLSVGDSLLALLCHRNGWLVSPGSTCDRLKKRANSFMTGATPQFGTFIRGGSSQSSSGLGSGLGTLDRSALQSFFSSNSGKPAPLGVGFRLIFDIFDSMYGVQCVMDGGGSGSCEMAKRSSNLAAVYFSFASVKQQPVQQPMLRSPVPKNPAPIYYENLYTVCNSLGHDLITPGTVPGITSASLIGFVNMITGYTDFVRTNRAAGVPVPPPINLRYGGDTLMLEITNHNLYLAPVRPPPPPAGTQLPNWDERYPTKYPLTECEADWRQYYVSNTQFKLKKGYKHFFAMVAISSEVLRSYAQVVSVLLALSNKNGGTWKRTRMAFAKKSNVAGREQKKDGFLMMCGGGTVDTTPGIAEGHRAKQYAKERLRNGVRDSGMEADLDYSRFIGTPMSAQVLANNKRQIANWLNRYVTG